MPQTQDCIEFFFLFFAKSIQYKFSTKLIGIDLRVSFLPIIKYSDYYLYIKVLSPAKARVSLRILLNIQLQSDAQLARITI